MLMMLPQGPQSSADQKKIKGNKRRKRVNKFCQAKQNKLTTTKYKYKINEQNIGALDDREKENSKNLHESFHWFIEASISSSQWLIVHIFIYPSEDCS